MKNRFGLYSGIIPIQFFEKNSIIIVSRHKKGLKSCFLNMISSLKNTWFVIPTSKPLQVSGGKPYFIKKGKEKLYFSILSLLSWHITFYKIYSTVPFKSFIYAAFRSLKKEPDTVCSTMLGSLFYKK